MENEKIILVECPRDAMQGWKSIIPTPQKIEYLNSLLQVGFDVLDFGSFVSAQAIPQMADTREVIKGLSLEGTHTQLLAIIANVQGAEEAIEYESIHYLGFPFSVSETFQRRNTNSSMLESMKRVEAIQNTCLENKRELVVYLSMAFGNPYGDPYSEEMVLEWARRIADLGVHTISLADTVGLAKPEQVYSTTFALIQNIRGSRIGLHLHSSRDLWQLKVDKALEAGCRRFDGALKGIGGCPMANDELVGNIDTEQMIPYFEGLGLLNGLNRQALQKSSILASQIFI